MHWLIWAMCWVIFGAGLAPAFAQSAEKGAKELQGTWTATQAEQEGKAADDIVGHRLSFTGNRFEIRSKDGKSLFAGTARVDARAKPASIDFEHTQGAVKGKAWKGIYALEADTLTICDNAPIWARTDPPRSRPRADPGMCSSRSSARNPEKSSDPRPVSI